MLLSLGISKVRTVGRPKRFSRSEPSGSTTVAVRADPVGLPAAAGEMPVAGDPVAARRGDGAGAGWAGPRRPGRADRPRSRAPLRAGYRARSAPAVGDERVPADRAVGAADLLDRAHIGPGSTWSPPTERGSSMRNSRASCSLSTRAGGRRRPFSISLPSAAIAGARALARDTGSTAWDLTLISFIVGSVTASSRHCGPRPRCCQSRLFIVIRGSAQPRTRKPITQVHSGARRSREPGTHAHEFIPGLGAAESPEPMHTAPARSDPSVARSWTVGVHGSRVHPFAVPRDDMVWVAPL